MIAVPARAYASRAMSTGRKTSLGKLAGSAVRAVGVRSISASATPTSASAGTRRAPRPSCEAVKRELDELQQRLFAEGERSLLLVVCRRCDAAGKDGTIRTIFVRAQPGRRAGHGFKVPSGAEPAHDYLWRVHAALPGARRDRRVQPQPLRGRARRAGQGLRPEGAVEAALPAHPRVRADARRRGHDDRQDATCTSPRTSSASGSRTALDDPTKRWKFRDGDLDDRGAVAGVHEGLRGRRSSETSHRRTPRGTWCRPTATGCATSPSPRSCCTRWRQIDPQFPPDDPRIDGPSM